MRLTVPFKLYRELHTALLLRTLDMDATRARRAMINMACFKHRKERLSVKVWTMWYRRYERRHYDR